MPQHRLASFLIHERTVVVVIVLNALALFLDAFPDLPTRWHQMLFWIDYGCMIFFVVEAVLKIKAWSFSGYWKSLWNRMDFLIVLGSVPLLFSPLVGDALHDLSILLLLRLGRLLRFSRLLRSVPNASQIGRGMVRALKASVAVFLVLFVLNLILAMGANLLFGDLEAARPYFGDPLVSFYSLFKVFTIEGWYEIPDHLARSGASSGMILLLRLYFMGAVLIGGLLGLSMANAVFVDEMTSDNTNRVEEMVAELRQELQEFRKEMRQNERLKRDP